MRNPEFRRPAAPGRIVAAAAIVAALALSLVPVADTARKDLGPAERVFEITASRFRFDPDILAVTEGDQVRITVRSADGVHGILIKELKVRLKVPKGGEAVSVGFVASRVGTYEIACSEYCGSGHRNMKARLVVMPRGSR